MTFFRGLGGGGGGRGVFFCPFLFIMFKKSINMFDGKKCSFNRGNTEGTNSSKKKLMFVHVCFVLCLYRDWFGGLT